MSENKRPVQYFSDEYLENCRNLRPEDIVEFVEGFRELHSSRANATAPKRKPISIRMPEPLLKALKGRARLENVPYQTLILRILERALN